MRPSSPPCMPLRSPPAVLRESHLPPPCLPPRCLVSRSPRRQLDLFDGYRDRRRPRQEFDQRCEPRLRLRLPHVPLIGRPGVGGRCVNDQLEQARLTQVSCGRGVQSVDAHAELVMCCFARLRATVANNLWGIGGVVAQRRATTTVLRPRATRRALLFHLQGRRSSRRRIALGAVGKSRNVPLFRGRLRGRYGRGLVRMRKQIRMRKQVSRFHVVSP